MVNKITNIKERVIEVAKWQPQSQAKFYRSIGMTSGSFRGKALYSPLNSDALVNIITNYSEVTADWLVMGEGKSPWEVEIEDSGDNSYGLNKDEIIAVLKDRIEDLKKDKEDLLELLRLAKGKD